MGKILGAENLAFDYDQFRDHIGDLRSKAFFKKMGLNIETQNAYGLFQLLDFEDTGMITLDSFIMGIQALNGEDQRIDMARLRFDVHQIKKALGCSGKRKGSCASAKTSQVSIEGEMGPVAS